MALRDKSLFLYNLQVTSLNRNLDFRTAAIGPTKTAILRLGYYSLSSLLSEIVAQMKAVDTAFNFTATADRTFVGGTQNRVTLTTTSSFFSLLFFSGPNNATTVAPLIGFSSAVDRTGSTSYQGIASAGTPLVTEWFGNNWQSPLTFRKNFGAVNISANGEKETIVFSIQQFMTVEFKFEPESKVYSSWVPLIDWMISQRPFDFTPETPLAPTIFYDVTLEKSSEDGKGLGFMMKEMLPSFPFAYTTGSMTFRRRGT